MSNDDNEEVATAKVKEDTNGDMKTQPHRKRALPVSASQMHADLFSHTRHALSESLQSKDPRRSRPTTVGIFLQGTPYTDAKPAIFQVTSGVDMAGWPKFVRELDCVSDLDLRCVREEDRGREQRKGNGYRGQGRDNGPGGGKPETATRMNVDNARRPLQR